jgi:TldD protein
MRSDRRTFLKLAGGAAAALSGGELFGDAAATAQTAARAPEAALVALADVALSTARKLGTSYADIRINRYRDRTVSLLSTPEAGTGRINHVPAALETGAFGFGVRVLHQGTWGFAASPRVTRDEVAAVTARAVALARAHATLQRRPVDLAPTPPHVDRWSTAFVTDPFGIEIGAQLALLQRINSEIKSVRDVFSATSLCVAHSEDRFLATSEGTRVQQYVLHTYGLSTARARDAKAGVSRSRSYVPPPNAGGWENIERAGFLDEARRIGEEVVEHLAAPAVEPGEKSLVLMPGNLALTIHETIGHSTELDRAIGFEASYAGTSFLTRDLMGRFRIGSDLMHIVGDRTLPGGLATVGYDDDGVKAREFDIVRGGTFVQFQTTRELASEVGQKESMGCCQADSFSSVQFQRMPNVSLKPGETGTTTGDLISRVDDGLLMDGRALYSIDQQRYNFQFSADACWEIKGGKKGRMISRAAYHGRTPDFWAGYLGSADERHWRKEGFPADGKGEPPQNGMVTHACAPSLFEKVSVIRTS